MVIASGDFITTREIVIAINVLCNVHLTQAMKNVMKQLNVVEFSYWHEKF